MVGGPVAESEPLDVYPGPDFWDAVRAELTRTGVSTLVDFDRDELRWVLTKFQLYWDRLLLLLDDQPDYRFARFRTGAGWEYAVIGWRHGPDVVELIDFEVTTPL